jgi:hypothetical protein
MTIAFECRVTPVTRITVHPGGNHSR